jgi:hypothetical protein
MSWFASDGISDRTDCILCGYGDSSLLIWDDFVIKTYLRNGQKPHPMSMTSVLFS